VGGHRLQNPPILPKKSFTAVETGDEVTQSQSGALSLLGRKNLKIGTIGKVDRSAEVALDDGVE
jgi:hypothetical protein